MKWLVTALLLCALPHHSTAVTELTDQNFYGYAQDKEVLLVDFYAPWCGDCKNLDPDFESAARSLGQRSVDLVKVDCFGAGKGLCATYGVKSWPTLKNFNRGQYTGDYNGGLSAAELAGYITTVENSVIQQGVSPYAASQPQPSIPVDVACNKKCKLERAKASKLASKLAPVAPPAGAPAVLAPPAPLMPSKEQLNAMECAKCKIMQPAEKLILDCPASMKKTCIAMASLPVPYTPSQDPPLTSADDGMAPEDALEKPYEVNDKKSTENVVSNPEEPTATKPSDASDKNETVEWTEINDNNEKLSEGVGSRLEDAEKDVPVPHKSATLSENHVDSDGEEARRAVDALTPKEAMKVPYDVNDKKVSVVRPMLTTKTGGVEKMTPKEALRLPYDPTDRRTILGSVSLTRSRKVMTELPKSLKKNIVLPHKKPQQLIKGRGGIYGARAGDLLRANTQMINSAVVMNKASALAKKISIEINGISQNPAQFGSPGAAAIQKLNPAAAIKKLGPSAAATQRLAANAAEVKSPLSGKMAAHELPNVHADGADKKLNVGHIRGKPALLHTPTFAPAVSDKKIKAEKVQTQEVSHTPMSTAAVVNTNKINNNVEQLQTPAVESASNTEPAKADHPVESAQPSTNEKTTESTNDKKEEVAIGKEISSKTGVNSLSPREALRLPYDPNDKKSSLLKVPGQHAPVVSES